MNVSTLVSLQRRDDVGLILIDNPPVNVLSRAVRQGLSVSLAAVLSDPSVRLVLIACSGRTFIAGMDIAEFDAPMEPPLLQDLQALIEGAAKPIVAALHGTALGGGLELALACHARVALDTARLGLPEITLGIIPGAGGTQRLPRLIGACAALDMMLSGAPVNAGRAKTLGLVDEVVSGDLLAGALAFCRTLIESGAGPRRTSEQRVDATGFDSKRIAQALQDNARALKGRTTQTVLLEALKAAVERPFGEGLALEHKLATGALATPESQALRHIFFAERRASQVPGLPKGAGKPICRAAVIGAGTMGSGIATAFADAGLPVILIDSTADGLARGEKLIRSNYAANVKRGRMTEANAAARIAQITGSLDIGAAAAADVVVEAVFEDLDLKKRVLAQIDALVSPEALIATNTSSLSVTEMAAVTRHPARVVGLHFFSPAHVMPLLEIVRGAKSEPAAIATSLEVAKTLRKIGVVSGDSFGFIGNRMMLDGYFREAEQLMLEGASPAQVDGALEAFGFPMGPNRVSDLGGNDVGTQTRVQLYRRETRPDPYFVIADALTGQGRFGQKSGSGFYRYEEGGRKAVPDPEVIALIERLARERGITRRAISAEEIVERCTLALINVGAQLLREGVAARASDIDVVWTSGYGFPRHRGGPMFHADALGLAHVRDRIQHYERFLSHYWHPAALITELAADNGTFAKRDRAQ
jgi:3-hydroxyacyl-CoA dehydrogenase